MATERSQQLQDLAQHVADALPLKVAGEVMLTGSVSRGVADEISDIEMLLDRRADCAIGRIRAALECRGASEHLSP